MRAYIKKKILNSKDLKGTFYVLRNLEFCCDKCADLFSLNILRVVNGNLGDTYMNFTLNEDEDKNFFIGIVTSELIDDGDYDYDDNWISNYVEVNSFYKIISCPVCGEKFEIIIEEEDITSEYNRIKSSYPKNKKTRADKNLIKYLDKQLEDLLRSDFY